MTSRFMKELKMNIERPDWRVDDTSNFGVDLSMGVHYDRMLHNNIQDILIENRFDLGRYQRAYTTYKALSKHYNISMDNMSIGTGATEVIERIFKSIKFDHLYIVEPSFEMVEVYCKIYNKSYTLITYDDIDSLSGEAIYIANPNGNNGTSHNIQSIFDKFDLCIVDEAYADFYPTNSVLHDIPDNCIVVKTLSKSLGLAGYRIGFAVANDEYTNQLQQTRSNFVVSSLVANVIPLVIGKTTDVIARMHETQKYLESKYDVIPSHGNYVLFKERNKYTYKFNCKKLKSGYYRMSLTDTETLNV